MEGGLPSWNDLFEMTEKTNKQINKAIYLLRQIEWIEGGWVDDECSYFCPFCHGREDLGHNDNCELQQFKESMGE